MLKVALLAVVLVLSGCMVYEQPRTVIVKEKDRHHESREERSESRRRNH